MVVGITIMKTNKMGHFICGVLATYGLVVACGNMKREDISLEETDEGDGKQSCWSKLCNKKTEKTERKERLLSD